MTARTLQKLPAPHDRRSRHSMAQFIRECLAGENRGWSRSELEALMRLHPRFRRQPERNRKALSETLRRLQAMGQIEEQGGLLFVPEWLRIAILVRIERFEIVR